MSVLCCQIPDFLLTITSRSYPQATEQPFALLGPDERVCAASLPAQQSGVHTEMPARQAQMRCHDIVMRPLDAQTSQDEQDAFLGLLSDWQLPVEAQNWGVAYVDLNRVANKADEVHPLAAELGRKIRLQMGKALQPSLGWDSGKFTARAAATYTQPGRMRLVGKQAESRFLSPLSITLLPLPLPDQQQLHWLGIRTLGQFATLPSAAVWQRFGAAGRLAQSWARGHDDRPVRSTVEAALPPIDIELDPPTSILQAVVETAMAELEPHMQTLRERLEGFRRLHLDARFLDGDTRRISISFIEATCQQDRLRQALTNKLQTLEWPDEMEHATLSILETAELSAHQMTLFPELLEGASPLQAVVEKLATRYRDRLFKGQIVQPHHLLADRRIGFQTLSLATANP